MGDYRVFTRKAYSKKAGGKYIKQYVAEFTIENGRKKQKKLKAQNQTEAHEEANRLAHEVIGVATENPDILYWLNEYWNIDGRHAKLKEVRGTSLSKGYVAVHRYTIKKWLQPKLRGMKLNQLKTTFLDDLVLKLKAEGATFTVINKVIESIRIPMNKWARENRIPNPLEYWEKLPAKAKERGTLSFNELKKIESLRGLDVRVRAGILLGAKAGLRIGEILGLMPGDIDRENFIIKVSHNWQEGEGIKLPKSKKSRITILVDSVARAIDDCLKAPHPSNPYVIWNEKSQKRPSQRYLLIKGFHDALKKIGITDEERKERNLVFHSLRHCFASMTQASGLPVFAVQEMLGHSSLDMTRHYTHAEKVIDFKKAKEALEAVPNEKKIATR